jgi:class 3 adenylate cyclase
MILQTLLGLRIGPIGATIVFSNLMMVFASLGCRYLIGRVRGLVRDATAEQMRRERLGRYFSPEVATLLAEAGAGASSGESREVTVLFCDLRDFTSLTEHLSGPATLALLNAYYERMVRTVFAFGGTLDKYLGDGMMVYFGAPVPQADHAERAVRCALAMTDELARWNAERARCREAGLAMGVGIHSGTVIVGDVGAPARREYTAIGHAVNVAARLQELTKTHGAPILVSSDVRHAVGERLGFEPAGTVTLRGHSEAIAVFAPHAGS